MTEEQRDGTGEAMFLACETSARRLGKVTVFSCVVTMLFCGTMPSAVGQDAANVRCVVFELYHDGRDDAFAAAHAVVAELARDRNGVALVVRDIQDDRNRQRHAAIAKYFRIPATQLPLAYAANHAVAWQGSAEAFRGDCEGMLVMQVFVRRGCPHCAAAKEYLKEFAPRYPAFQLEYHDLVTDRTAVTKLNELVKKHRRSAASVPVFHVCNQLLIGFDRPRTTGPRLEKLFTRWTTDCPEKQEDRATAPKSSSRGPCRPLQVAHVFPGIDFPGVEANAAALSWLLPALLVTGENGSGDEAELPPPELPLPELPLPELPLPEIGEPDGDAAIPPDPSTASEPEREATHAAAGDSIVELPWFGSVDVRRLGLPLFTLAVGLVDGFNPCAMWVLLFLLSLLVNLKSRLRILAVAGSFVLVSGLAYFAFMAAWLNVFLLIGFLRPVQVFLGILGITVGAIHIKDFFAFKKGVTLSIPESAKPGIYARMRAIITAENLVGAIIAAVTLAVLVNIVELLCTAGLPALYTEVLARYQLAAVTNYLYLGLYILAYMLDDSIMVGVVVLTLNKRKLQESQGRWLKLVSGAVIAALGVVVIVQPDWLM